MKSFIAIVILIGLAYWAFRAGKREGSAKGCRRSIRAH